jgi:hypothetical protein
MNGERAAIDLGADAPFLLAIVFLKSYNAILRLLV